jgi:predicted transcriptional regulator YdeE
MSEPNKKPNHIPESYSPVKPVILNMVKKIDESTSEIPAIEIYQAHREPYYVLGIENKTPNGTVGDWGACWNQFFKSDGHNKIKPFLIEEPLLGVFCQSGPGYYNYLIGGVVSRVTDIPEGMYLTDFPATDYMVVTHE